MHLIIPSRSGLHEDVFGLHTDQWEWPSDHFYSFAYKKDALQQ